MVWTTLRTNNTERGSIAYNGSGTNFNNTSDYRLKFDVKDIDEEECIERMKKLRTRTYRWREFPEKLHRGFIAHELDEDNFGLAVTGKKDEVDASGNPVYQSIDPRYMLADVCCCLKYLIKDNEETIFELEEKDKLIDVLQTKIQTLETKLNEICNFIGMK